MGTSLERRTDFILRAKVSGSLVTYKTAQKAAVDNQGSLYKMGGSNDVSNVFSDKNGKSIKMNDVVKFVPAFLKFVPGNWQIFPSASSGRSQGDGEVVLVNSNWNWNIGYDSKDHKNLISSSFIEFVDDGPQ